MSWLLVFAGIAGKGLIVRWWQPSNARRMPPGVSALTP
jgi:hypothetical protein